MPTFLEMMTMICMLNLITLGVFGMAYFVQQVTKIDGKKSGSGLEIYGSVMSEQ